MTTRPIPALENFEHAVRQHAFIGAQPENIRAELEAEYTRAKARLVLMLQRGFDAANDASRLRYPDTTGQ